MQDHANGRTTVSEFDVTSTSAADRIRQQQAERSRQSREAQIERAHVSPEQFFRQPSRAQHYSRFDEQVRLARNPPKTVVAVHSVVQRRPTVSRRRCCC